MAIYSERTFLKERADAIKLERRALTDEYWKIQERLRALDEQEFSLIDTESVVQNLTVIVDRLLSYTAPPAPTHIEIPPVQPEPVKAVQPAVPDGTKHTYAREAEAIEKVIEFLKEQGAPVRNNVIARHLKETYGWEWNNFTGTMNRFMERDSRITRAYRGYYQYHVK